MPLMPPHAIYTHALGELVRTHPEPRHCLEKLNRAVNALEEAKRLPRLVDTDPIGSAQLEIQAVLDYVQIEPVIRRSQYFAHFLELASEKKK